MAGCLFYYFLLMIFSILSSPNASAQVQYDKKYFLELYGETLIDGSQVYMRYDIVISDNKKKANIKLTTWHAPISCDGDYNIKKNNNEYTLSYLGGLDGCAYPSPQFYIMKKGEVFYIKGAPLVYGKGKWLKLSRSEK